MHYVDYNTFLMFGDSITEFSFNQFPVPGADIHFSLGSALQNEYARKLQVLQRGFSGYTSREAVHLVKSILKTEFDEVPDSKKIQIAYVFFGTNDARKRGESELNKQSIPIDKYLENMKIVISEFQKRNIPLIVITPGLHDSKLWHESHPEDLNTGDYRSNDINKRYQDILKENVQECPVLCLYDEMISWVEANGSAKAKAGDYSEILCDGIHFTGTGYKILFEGLLRLIEGNFKHLSPSLLEYRFPHYSELTEDTFEKIN